MSVEIKKITMMDGEIVTSPVFNMVEPPCRTPCPTIQVVPCRKSQPKGEEDPLGEFVRKYGKNQKVNAVGGRGWRASWEVICMNFHGKLHGKL